MKHPRLSVGFALVLWLALAGSAAAFSLVSMQPNYDRFEVFNTEPLVLVFDASLNEATVGDDAIVVTNLRDAQTVEGVVTLETTTLENDTLRFTPTAGKFEFGRRLQVSLDDALRDVSADPFTGALPDQGVFVGNIPNNFERPASNDDQFTSSAALIGFDPYDPESTDTSKIYTIPGMSVTEGWKMSTGDPSVLIVVMDDGADDMQNVEFADHLFLNRGELPQPRIGDTPCADWDCNNDGRFNAWDYADDPAMSDANSNGRLDPEDLFALFEDGADNDDNGFVDDISGWDFFRDVNTPLGVDEFPEGTHGGGIGRDAASIADTGRGDRPGTCPDCTLMFVRVGEAVVTEQNIMAAGIAYATAMGADVVAIANGCVDYSAVSQQAFIDAYEAGVFVASASGDELGFHHIYPAAGEDVYSLKAVLPIPPLELFGPINLDLLAFTESYCTNYGPSVETSVSSDQCTSTATANLAGIAGLIKSYGRERGFELSPGEIKQLLNMTADDIENRCFAFNLGGCKPGFDQNFGYGRVNVLRALEALGDPFFDVPERIPPMVRITSPHWWDTIDPTQKQTLPVEGEIDARGRDYQYVVEVGVGVEPDDADFEIIATGSGSAPTNGLLTTIDPMDIVNEAWLGRTPENANDFTITLRVRAWWLDGSTKIYGEARKAIAWHTDQEEQTGLVPTFPKDIGASGESSPVLYDLDGDLDGAREIIFATNLPTVEVYKRNAEADAWDLAPGFPVDLPFDRLWRDAVIASVAVGPLFGDGIPYIVIATWYGQVFAIHPDGNDHPGGPFVEGFPVAADEPDNTSPLGYGHGNAFLASPVLIDLDLDGMLEIVAASSDQKAYAWKPVDDDHDGEADRLSGWPVPLDSSDEAGIVPNGKRCEADGPAQVLGTPVAGILDPDHENIDISGHPSVIVSTTETCNEGLLPTTRVYAVYWNGMDNEEGPFLPDWPAEPLAPLGDALPIPPLTVGSTSSPAAIRYDGQLLVGVGAFFWFPQMIYWDGDETTIRHLRSRLNLGVSAGGTFGRVDSEGTPWYFFPTAGFLQATEDEFYLEGFGIVGWSLDDQTGKPGFVKHLDDINFFINPILADLDNDGLSEVIAGSGGYLIHAANVQYAQPEGWPKFTFGWMTGSPAVADIDGDRLLEVVAYTHNGDLFAWNTRGDECAGEETNGDWTRFHHDPSNSGFYGNDAEPPALVTDLRAYLTDDADTFDIVFTATGDDGRCGTASLYDLRYTTDSGADLRDPDVWQAATAIDAPTPVLGGEEATVTVTAPGAAAFAVRAYDEQGLASFVSNVATPEAGDDDDDTADDDDDDDDTADDDDDDDDESGGGDDDDDSGCGC